MGCLTQNVLTLRISPFGARYREPVQLVNFYTELLARVRALPGVDEAGFVDVVPGQGYWEDMGFNIVEHPALPPGHGLFTIDRWADPGYFAAMGIPLLQGHSFDPSKHLDHADEAVISKLFADRYLPGEYPLGKHLHTHDGRVLTKLCEWNRFMPHRAESLFSSMATSFSQKVACRPDTIGLLSALPDSHVAGEKS